MRRTVIAGILALSASTALAQTNSAPEPIAPAPETVSPIAPADVAPIDPADVAPIEPAAAPQASSGGPADICDELLAFMKAPPPEEAAAAPAANKEAEPAQQTTQTEQAAADQQEGQSQDQQTAPAQETASALAGTVASDEGASAEPETETNSAQQVTGQDGVASDAPEPTDEKVAAGSVANAPQKESRAAPLPPADVSSTPKESVVTVEQAEELADAGDIAQCQSVAREMRVAGISMPPPLIALAALDLQYQQGSGAAASPVGTGEPASGENPASGTQEQ